MKSNKPLKIYLGDLTYDTVTLATEAMPLNIGFAASYCIKKFGSNVDITLFKYIEELDAAIHNSPPDILGLSNYCWSHNVSLEIFKMLRKVKPDALTIMGGPNFPIDFPSQGKFMKKHSQIDFYVPVDGEEGFSNIVGQALNSTREKMREEVLESEDADKIKSGVQNVTEASMKLGEAIYKASAEAEGGSAPEGMSEEEIRGVDEDIVDADFEDLNDEDQK